MAYLRDTAIVLKNEAFREQDAWVTLYGREFGKLVAVARGGRAAKAKQLGHLEPLSTVQVMIAKGQAFDKLAVARATRSTHSIRASLPALTVISAFTDLVAQATHPQAPDEQIFYLLEALLLQLEQTPSTISAERATLLYASAVLHLLNLLGYASQLDRCTVCHVALDERAWVVGVAGGLVCDACLQKEPSWRERAQLLQPDHKKLLLFLQKVSFGEVLKISAPVEYFQSVIRAVEELSLVLPLRKKPHGFITIPGVVG